MVDTTRFISAKFSGSLSDQLKLREFVGTEGVSTLFRFDLKLTAETPIPRSQLETQLLGQDVTVNLHTSEAERKFSGCISELVTQSLHDGRVELQATMVPFLWFLGKKSDCRVFQDQTTIDIVKKVIDDAGQVVDKTNGKNITKWPYCVQFRETDLNFVCRLLEQDGIFYYFEHSEGEHKLVLGNENSHFLEPGGDPIDLKKGDQQGGSYADELDTWQMQLATVSGKWAHGDYNFEDAKTKLVSDDTVEQPVKRANSLEMFDYPGEYFKKAEGDTLAMIRSREVGHDRTKYTADSRSRQIESGRAFVIGKHPDSDAAGNPFVVLSATHVASTNDEKFSGDGTTNTYRNHFTAIPHDTSFHPPRLTPKPSVNGVQSAVVVGPPGEEIYTDEYGRVKVRFHWDRTDNDHDKRSCFIRCAQMLAGREWGFMAIPRIGQEVIVEFLDGDPDCPLIVGSVYNSDQMPAYNPKQMASRIYLKSNSTKGGGGFNEIMLDDRKDSERLFFHAQKDLDIRVRNDVRKRVYGNEHQVIGWEKNGDKGGSQYVRVLHDNQLHVERNQDEHIEGNYSLLVGAGQADEGGTFAAIFEKNVAIAIGEDGLSMTNQGDVAYQVDGSTSTTIGKDMMLKISGDCHHTITGDHNEKAANLSIDLAQQGNIKAGMKLALDAGNEIHIKSGTSLVIESGAAVTLKVGGNFININPGGVFIQGSLVGINSGGAAGPGTGCMVKPPKPPEPVRGEPKKAAPKEPDHAHKEKTGKVSK
jgi:type VI secretion system secreted protein VgrG